MMDTQIFRARKGELTPAISEVARQEGIDPEQLAQKVSAGKVAIPANTGTRHVQPVGIGEGLRVKVNANMGTSSDQADVAGELEKLTAAVEAKADAVMDLSTGGDINRVREQMLKHCSLPVGTVPIYQAAIEIAEKKGGIVFMSPDDLFDVIERQAREGVDFMTVHSGVTRHTLQRLQNQGRVTDIVSRGGAFLATWMLYNDRENPLYEQFDRLVEIARRYDVTLSLGDGLRPGCIADATDRAQVAELSVLGELTEDAWASGVQVMIEGPGHIPFHQIETNIRLEKDLCNGAPFYVLGPLVTDVAPGYDHIVAAIGGTMAAYAGADFLCYVTPAEHLKLPTAADVHEGIISSRIAAHAADIARGHPGAAEWDLSMAHARKELDWKAQVEKAIDPAKAEELHNSGRTQDDEGCTMCGKYCAIKLVKEFLHQK